MAAPQHPQAGPNRPRRPRAWLARRIAAVLSVVAALGLGGLMYWNDQQGTAGATQAATGSSANTSGSITSGSITSGSTTTANRSHRESGESEDGSGSANTSNGSTSEQQTVTTPHTNTRGS
jgi:hypothetical protein